MSDPFLPGGAQGIVDGKAAAGPHEGLRDHSTTCELGSMKE